ncbi:MAG: hypothetical protein J6R06_07770 [Bacteroidales bacterium]|nr:hypothetical protein [Bacteroidales bacterium]
MRKQLKLLLISLLTFSCIQLYSQENVFYLSESNGCISLRVTAYGKKCKEAIENAEIIAIKKVLFIGIPNSKILKQPLIGTNESEIINNNNYYFDEFFDKKRYKNFISSCIPITEFKRDITRKKSITVDIVVNIQILRADLESEGIIPKFGFF